MHYPTFLHGHPEVVYRSMPQRPSRPIGRHYGSSAARAANTGSRRTSSSRCRCCRVRAGWQAVIGGIGSKKNGSDRRKSGRKKPNGFAALIIFISKPRFDILILMPPNLSETYRPDCISGFAGLERPRALLSALANDPYSSAWLLVGPSGIGKTRWPLAVHKQIGGSLHHIPSRKCDLATVESVVRACWYAPMIGRWHVVLVDEADKMTIPPSSRFSQCSTPRPPRPIRIFIFTANATKTLRDR